MRRAAKVDQNQADIVNALRRVGCAVQDLSAVGKGVPDLLVARAGINTLIEIKRPKAKGQRAGSLTPDQVRWIAEWPTDVWVVSSVDEALAAVGLAS